MESFELYSAVRGYHVYSDVWESSVGEKLEESSIITSTKSIEPQRNGRPFTAQILENSMVFSHSWWIDFCRSEWPSSTL